MSILVPLSPNYDGVPLVLPVDTSNSYFLRLAFQLKDKTAKPRQSLFRVFSIITFRDDSIPKDKISFVIGANCECCFISNNICAERSALTQLRQRTGCVVDKIFIVCDSQAFITPGVLCREFMFDNFCNGSTLIITCGQNQIPSVFTLDQLYPFPNVYISQDRNQVIGFGKQFALSSEVFNTTFGDSASWVQLYNRLVDYAKRDRKVHLHPISYVAGVLFKNGHTTMIAQSEGIEYGCSIDAVSRLGPFIENQPAENPPELILQVDQFGILHAPCSVGRSFLYEKGYLQTKIPVHDKYGKLHIAFITELVPHYPKSEDLLKQNSKL